jgi:hypothetical protein
VLLALLRWLGGSFGSVDHFLNLFVFLGFLFVFIDVVDVVCGMIAMA